MFTDKFPELLQSAPKELVEIKELITAGLKDPQKLQIGLGSSRQVGDQAAQLVAGKRALIVSDEIIENLGVVDLISTSLSEAGFSVEIFTKVEAEPHIETADALHSLHSSDDISVVVGVGGGSVMDMSKLVAQSLGHKITPQQYLDSGTTQDKKGLPLILLPTTSGTGSEVSCFFLVTCGKVKKVGAGKHLLPEIAIIDPLLTVSMPPIVTAGTGMDALTHALEGMMHAKSSPLSETFSLGAIDMIMRFLRRAVADGEDLEARYNMSLASAMGMMAFNLTGPLYAHSVAYVLALYKPTPHGLGCSLGLPYLMDYNSTTAPEGLAKVARIMDWSTGGLESTDAAKKAVHAVTNLIQDIGLPLTLKEYGIDEKNLEKMAKETLELFPRPFNSRPMAIEGSISYWKAMFEGSL